MLRRARRAGVAEERDETDIGVTCVGAAVLAPAERPYAAISVSLPSVRFGPQRRREVVAAVRHAAAEVTEALNHSIPPEPAAR